MDPLVLRKRSGTMRSVRRILTMDSWNGRQMSVKGTVNRERGQRLFAASALFERRPERGPQPDRVVRSHHPDPAVEGLVVVEGGVNVGRQQPVAGDDELLAVDDD